MYTKQISTHNKNEVINLSKDKKEQKIGCEVHDCQFCDCDTDECVKKEIKVCSCSPEKEKKATMCDSYKEKEE